MAYNEVVMDISPFMSDEAVLRELGKRLLQARIERSLTQERLAERAGVGKRTVERMERGESVQSMNLVRVLRALELLAALDALLPEPTARPMELLARGAKPRRRATSPRSEGVDGSAWVWEDEK